MRVTPSGISRVTLDLRKREPDWKVDCVFCVARFELDDSEKATATAEADPPPSHPSEQRPLAGDPGSAKDDKQKTTAKTTADSFASLRNDKQKGNGNSKSFAWREPTARMGCIMNRLVMALALVSVVPAGAQTAMPPANATAFKDTSAFKPPRGAKVAIIGFEDVESALFGHVSP